MRSWLLLLSLIAAACKSTPASDVKEVNIQEADGKGFHYSITRSTFGYSFYVYLCFKARTPEQCQAEDTNPDELDYYEVRDYFAELVRQTAKVRHPELSKAALEGAIEGTFYQFRRDTFSGVNNFSEQAFRDRYAPFGEELHETMTLILKPAKKDFQAPGFECAERSVDRGSLRLEEKSPDYRGFFLTCKQPTSHRECEYWYDLKEAKVRGYYRQFTAAGAHAWEGVSAKSELSGIDHEFTSSPETVRSALMTDLAGNCQADHRWTEKRTTFDVKVPNRGGQDDCFVRVYEDLARGGISYALICGYCDVENGDDGLVFTQVKIDTSIRDLQKARSVKETKFPAPPSEGIKAFFDSASKIIADTCEKAY